MTNASKQRRAFLASALALLLCIAMLAGTTYAWFTDSVINSGNKVKAGILKIDLELLDKEGNWNSIKNDEVPLFDYDRWEPGYTTAHILKVENEDNLALKWKAMFVSEDELDGGLADAIEVYVNPNEEEAPAYPADRKALTEENGWYNVGTVKDFVNTIAETTRGVLLPKGSANGADVAYLGIALKMREDAGNEYMGLDIGGEFDICILATQLESEEDYFGSDYDKDAVYPVAAEYDDSTILRKEDVTTLYRRIFLPDDGSTVLDFSKTIRLNHKTINADRKTPAIEITGGATEVVIDGSGTIKNKVANALTVSDAATLTIKNGTYYGDSTAVIVNSAILNIEGGYFEALSGDAKGLLVADENSTVTVTGGTFVNYDPSAFVPATHAVREHYRNNGDIWYEVEPAAEDGITLDDAISMSFGKEGFTGAVINNGNFVIDGADEGIFKSDVYAIDNRGNATVSNIEVVAGTPSHYAGISRGEKAITVYNNVDLTSGGGGIAVADGAQAIFNSGKVYIDTASTSGRYIFYVEGEGSVLTINDGEFSWDPKDNQKRAYIYAGAGTTVYVNGGTFGKASTRSGYTAGILGTGNVIITGGTFGFDPSAWLADGYVAEKANGVWTVYYPQSSFDELINNAQAGDTVKVPVGNFTLSGNNNLVIVGSGAGTVIDIVGNIDNVNISNATVVGATSLNVAADQTAVFNNVVFTDKIGMTAQGVLNGNATFTGCTFEGGLHIDKSEAGKSIKFIDCTFGELAIIKLGGSANYSMEGCTIETLDMANTTGWGRDWLIVYSNIQFTNCEMGRVVRAGAAITITLDCCADANGVAVTEAIVHEYNTPTVVIK